MKKLSTYIDELVLDEKDDDKMVVEHRSNNPKRDYLFVNRKQGKHIPCRPSEAIEMFNRLAKKVNGCVSGYKNVLVIGFAETATAISNFVCNNISNCVYYLQTTREQVENCNVLVEFEEKHSHAVEQKIYSSKDISKMNIDCVVFVEDEISTGKTILNCIEKLQKTLGDNVKYCVASICNWQNEENRKVFDERNIGRIYLIGGKLKDEHMKMNINNEIDLDNTEWKPSGDVYNIQKVEISSKHYKDERMGYIPYNTKGIVKEISDSIVNILETSYKEPSNTLVAVIGTEEFMYIPMLVAGQVENWGYRAYNHANSRSSIDVIKGSTIGIANKTKLPSAYDKDRSTYIYNLGKYDKVFIVTDAEQSDMLDFSTVLIDRLVEFGMSSEDIYFIIINKN